MNIDHYAVIGNPIAHSKSPSIHSHYAKQTGQAMDYTRLLAPLDEFRQTVLDFRAAGGRGLNVTVPFKLEAYALADRLSPRAQRANGDQARGGTNASSSALARCHAGRARSLAAYSAKPGRSGRLLNIRPHRIWLPR